MLLLSAGQFNFISGGIGDKFSMKCSEMYHYLRLIIANLAKYYEVL